MQNARVNEDPKARDIRELKSEVARLKAIIHSSSSVSFAEEEASSISFAEAQSLRDQLLTSEKLMRDLMRNYEDMIIESELKERELRRRDSIITFESFSSSPRSSLSPIRLDTGLYGYSDALSSIDLASPVPSIFVPALRSRRGIARMLVEFKYSNMYKIIYENSSGVKEANIIARDQCIDVLYQLCVVDNSVGFNFDRNRPSNAPSAIAVQVFSFQITR